MRTYDFNKVVAATNQYAERITGFYPAEWLGDSDNVALINDNDDVALFQLQSRGVYFGHYFFWSRGRAAVAAARDFLNEIFNEYPVEVIQGLTPLSNLGAQWMNKRLGFRSQGVIKSATDTCEFVTMTRQDWKKYE